MMGRTKSRSRLGCVGTLGSVEVAGLIIFAFISFHRSTVIVVSSFIVQGKFFGLIELIPIIKKNLEKNKIS